MMSVVCVSLCVSPRLLHVLHVNATRFKVVVPVVNQNCPMAHPRHQRPRTTPHSPCASPLAAVYTTRQIRAFVMPFVLPSEGSAPLCPVRECFHLLEELAQ